MHIWTEWDMFLKLPIGIHLNPRNKVHDDSYNGRNQIPLSSCLLQVFSHNICKKNAVLYLNVINLRWGKHKCSDQWYKRLVLVRTRSGGIRKVIFIWNVTTFYPQKHFYIQKLGLSCAKLRTSLLKLV